MVTRAALAEPMSRAIQGLKPDQRIRPGGLATRKPLLLLRLPRVFLLRLAERSLLPLLFQEPPRSTARPVFRPAGMSSWPVLFAVYDTQDDQPIPLQLVDQKVRRTPNHPLHGSANPAWMAHSGLGQ